MAVRAGMGFGELPFEDASTFWRWIELLETGGVDSFWQSDSVVGKRHHLETMTTLAMIAGRTEKLKFGMNVASLGIREPVLLAKQCATIDYLTGGGRLLPAFGIGSKRSPDWAGTGAPLPGRGARTNEALEIITRLWAGERFDYDGTHFQLKSACIGPVPANPKLPMWVGGSTRPAIMRTARYASGWQGAVETPTQIAPIVKAIQSEAEKLGRRVPADHFGIGIPFRFGSFEDGAAKREAGRFEAVTKRRADTFLAVGDAQTLLDRLRAYSDAGVTKFVLRPIAGNHDDYFEQTKLFISEVQPHLKDIPVPY